VKDRKARIARAEARSRPFKPVKVHLLGRSEDETDDSAIDAYGRHLIGPEDEIVMLVGVKPKPWPDDDDPPPPRLDEARPARLHSPWAGDEDDPARRRGNGR
jgi:hypothetical protein